MIHKKQAIIYGCVVLLAFALRAYSPTPIDLIGDDATYAFRSVGYFDHMASQLQTTPYQWFEAVPWWAKLSFHDHPPVAFLAFHIIFGIFGMTTLVAHSIPILLGTLSVALCIAVGARLSSPRVGIIAGFLFAVTSLSIWISRVLYLETILIPLLLFTIYCALRARLSPSWWIITGFSFGLSIATKYTAIFLLPALCYLAYPLWHTKKQIRFGIFVAIAALTPVIIYNIFLYQTRGHFDYQLTRLFRITTQDWPRLAVTSSPASLISIFSSIQDAVSWPAAILFLLAAWWSFFRWIRNKNNEQGVIALLLLFFNLEIIFLGNAVRFLSPIIPFLCLSAGILLDDIWKGALGFTKIALLAGASFAVIAMCAYSINTHFLAQPWGRAGLAFSSTRGENYGYEQLDQYLLTLYQERDSVDDLWDVAAVEKTLYIFDSNINYFPKMWYVQRRVTYQGIPFTSSLEFRKLIQENGESYFPQKGYTYYVLIHALSGTLMVPADIRNKVADQMALTLEEQSMQNVTIQRSDGEPAFRVYFF
ncbi:MAG: glycosyltransferase family 39 protein [Patescibacteria group bacterium]